jgi:hypothetical protein
VVNSTAKVANLNADKLDGKDSGAFLPNTRYQIVGSPTFGSPDPRTSGLKAELSCDAGDMLMNGGFYTGTVNNVNVIQGSNNSVANTWTVEWWVPSGSSPGSEILVVNCLDTVAPAHAPVAASPVLPKATRGR